MKKSTKTKALKRAIFSSIMSMILCCSMLIGTTFAWFTDEVTNVNNKIVSGNLDVELYHKRFNSENNATMTDYDEVKADTGLFLNYEGNSILGSPVQRLQNSSKSQMKALSHSSTTSQSTLLMQQKQQKAVEKL